MSYFSLCGCVDSGRVVNNPPLDHAPQTGFIMCSLTLLDTRGHSVTLLKLIYGASYSEWELTGIQ